MEIQNQQSQFAPFELTKEFLEEVVTLIQSESKDQLKSIFEELHPVDITTVLYELDGPQSKYIIQLIDVKDASNIISSLDTDERKKFLKIFTSAEIAKYINVIESDDAVDILNEQPVKIREEVIALLPDREQARFIIDLMHYDKDCAGGLMQKELIKINVKQTVTECVEEIRRQAEEVEKVYTVYVVDDDGILLGYLPIRDIVLAKRGSKIEDIYIHEIVSVMTYTDGQEVADLMQKYDYESIPVTNIQGRLLGIITIDDVVDFITETAQENVQAITGYSEDVEEDDSVWKLVRARLPWLIGGMVGSFLAAKIIEQYNDQISRLPAISAFIPLIGSTGGNVGIQSSSLIVQSLADKSGLDSSLWVRLQKVLVVAILNGLIASIFTFCFSLMIDDGAFLLSSTVSLSIFSVVLLASLMGTITPLILSKININPAIASGPFITTTNDILGYGVYFLIVYLLL